MLAVSADKMHFSVYVSAAIFRTKMVTIADAVFRFLQCFSVFVLWPFLGKNGCNY